MKDKKRISKKQKYLLLFFIAIGYSMALYMISALIMAFEVTEVHLTLETFLSSWCKWDANHYKSIAIDGYKGVTEICNTCREAKLATGISSNFMEDGQHLCLVFFPLYPFAMRCAHIIVEDIRIAGMLISSLAYAGGCVYMYRLVRMDYSEKIARNSVILLSLFPFSFFFGGIMTEGLFFFVSAATLYYVRRHKWWAAVLFGILATMTRMQGSLLIVPAIIELLMTYRPLDSLKTKNYSNLKEMIKKGLFLPFMFIGIGIYLYINWKVEGDPLTFMIYQKAHWQQGICLPTHTLTYIFRNAFSSNYNIQMRVSLWIPQAVLFIVSVIILIYGAKRLRKCLFGYGVVYVLLTYSATWLLSAGRYISCGIPLFIGMSLATEKRTWLMKSLAILFSMLQIVYLCGFFNNLQIM